MKKIDCCALKCPEPVLQTKKALEEGDGNNIEVLVDNETARENVIRFAKKQGRQASWSEVNGFFRIIIAGTGQEESEPVADGINKTAENPVLLLTTDAIGTGSSELGSMLMRNFIYTLTQRTELPKALIFMNSGVKLCIKGSPALEELQLLENKETIMLVCGTCLDYYQLKEAHAVGEVSNMYDIADLLMDAERVITL